MPQFIPGLELSRRYYREVVRPILDCRFPGLPHAAARLGDGSDVLGFDTEMSADHDWGPTVQLFLGDEDAGRVGEVGEALGRELPDSFLGYRTAPVADLAVNHATLVTTVREFVGGFLGLDADRPLEAADWLVLPSQLLRAFTAGAVYHDGVGELTAWRTRLAYYPQDVWLYLLAAGWHRVSQEEHLMPRSGFVGDELGSAIIGSRLVRDVVSLGFLMERQYAPYPKWLGTAFGLLECAPQLSPLLRQAQIAERWPEREAALAAAYERLARMHNALGVTERLPETTSSFFDRPFRVVHGDVFAEALLARIADPAVRRIADRHLIGSVDQLTDNTDLRTGTWRDALRSLYAE